MKKIISLSVWGTNIRYLLGALKNAKLAETLFPEWLVFLYISEESYFYFKNISLSNTTIILIKNDMLDGSFWRFYPFFEHDGYVLSRDADSRLSLREKRVADEWIVSGKTFSIIKDHPRHFDFPMLAGMWGARTPLDESLKSRMLSYTGRHNYLIDQEFLSREIWPIASQNCFIHSMMDSSWFSESRSIINFIGQGYDDKDQPIY